MPSSVKGVKELKRKLQRHRKETGRALAAALLNGGYLIERESKKLVPIRLGELRRSGYTRKEGEGFNRVVIVGYTADYALWVHENVEMKWKGIKRPKPFKGVYWGPKGRQAKYLEAPFRERRTEIMKMLKEAVS